MRQQVLNNFLHLLLSLFCLARVTTSAMAQVPDADIAKSTSSNRAIEEITVLGEQSVSRLRLRIEKTQDEIYAFFNANNSSNRMDIVCTRRRPTGSNLLIRECEPRFLKELRVLKTRESRIGIGVGFTQDDLVGWSAQDYEKLQEEMLVLMTKHKEFSEKMADLADLTKDHEAQLEQQNDEQ